MQATVLEDLTELASVKKRQEFIGICLPFRVGRKNMAFF